MYSYNKQLFKTIIISAAASVITYLINFILTPFITSNIGIEAYGFVSIAKSAVSYADIIMTSLTAFIVRFISVSYHKGSKREAESYYSSSIVACLFLSVFIFIISIFITIKLEYFLNIPSKLIFPVKLLFTVSFINFIITTLNVPLSVFSYIKNRLDLIGKVKILAYIFEVITLYFLFSFYSPSVFFVGLGSLSASLVMMISYFSLKRRLLPDLSFKICLVKISKIRILVKNGIWNSFNSLGNVLNNGLDLIVSNLMLSSVETGQISIAKNIATIFQTVFVIVSQPFQPQMLKAYSNEDNTTFYRVLRKAMIVCGMFANIAFAGFLSLGMLYYKLWLPSENTELLYTLTLITVLNYITDGVLQPVYYISTLTVKNKVPCIITITGGLLNVISMFLLLRFSNLGIYSIVITTAVIMICINLIFNPIYASWCLHIKSGMLYRILLRDLISCSIMIFTFRIIAFILNPQGWLGLVFTAVIMCIIGIIIHGSIMYNFNELKTIFNAITQNLKSA